MVNGFAVVALPPGTYTLVPSTYLLLRIHQLRISFIDLHSNRINLDDIILLFNRILLLIDLSKFNKELSLLLLLLCKNKAIKNKLTLFYKNIFTLEFQFFYLI